MKPGIHEALALNGKGTEQASPALCQGLHGGQVGGVATVNHCIVERAIMNDKEPMAQDIYAVEHSGVIAKPREDLL